MPTLSRICVLVAFASVLASCNRTTHELDWAQWEAEGRVVERPAGLEVLFGEGAYRWTDGVVELGLSRVESFFDRGVRITVPVMGARGHETRFMLDTGSVGSLVALDAPLARELVLSRIPFQAEGTHASGYLGHLPVVRMGPLEGRDLTVSVVTESEIPDSERNILGIVHLYHTQLEHIGGRWTLRSGRARLAASEAGWDVVRLEPGTPVLRVQGPDGSELKALIDTGAYESFAIAGSRTGTYTISSIRGAAVHRFVVKARKDMTIREIAFGGHSIGLVLGMDVLTSREWRLTPDQSTWAFLPRR